MSTKSNRAFWTCLGAVTAYKLMDIGLANFLALDMLAHGTGPRGFLGIHWRGGDPTFGGNPHGSSAIRYSQILTQKPDGLLTEEIARDCIQNSQGYFHVVACRNIENSGDANADGIYAFFLVPKRHAVLASMGPFQTARPFWGMMIGLWTPTLRFKFKPESIEMISAKNPSKPLPNGIRLECDLDTGDAFAYRTKELVDPRYLGITGSLLQGIDRETPQRMQKHPLQAAIGLTCIAASSIIGFRTYRYGRLPQTGLRPFEMRPATAALFRTTKRVFWGCAAYLALHI